MPFYPTNSKSELILVFMAGTFVSATLNLQDGPLLSRTLVELLSPKYMIDGAFCAFLWYLFLSIYVRFFHKSTPDVVAVPPAMMVKARIQLKLRTEESIWQGAVHESGHALTLALLPDRLIPDILDVRVEKLTDGKTGSRGRLHYKFESGEEPGDLEFRKWLLVCFRAGNVAEKMLIGKEYMMSGNDYHQWEFLARNYCLHQEATYFASPQSESEAMLNSKTLNELGREIDYSLRQFFKANIDLLRDVANELKVVDELGKDELLNMRKRVVLSNEQWI